MQLEPLRKQGFCPICRFPDVDSQADREISSPAGSPYFTGHFRFGGGSRQKGSFSLPAMNHPKESCHDGKG